MMWQTVMDACFGHEETNSLDVWFAKVTLSWMFGDKMSLIFLVNVLHKGRNQEGLVKTLSDLQTHVVKSQHVCFHTEILQQMRQHATLAGQLAIEHAACQDESRLRWKSCKTPRCPRPKNHTLPSAPRSKSLSNYSLEHFEPRRRQVNVPTLPLHLCVKICGLWVEVCQIARM